MLLDRPGVVAPPPLIFALGIGLAFVLNAIFPISLGTPGLVIVGFFVIVFALLLAAWSLRSFHQAGTHVDPNRPTTAIVETGPYRYTRNPIYLAMALTEVGLGLIFSTVWPWILLVPVLVVMTRGVIVREERYLTQKFGDPYRAYQRRVRRWL